MQIGDCISNPLNTVLVNNIHADTFALFLGDRTHKHTDLFCYFAVAADDLAHIAGGDSELKHGLVSIFTFCDLHFVGIIDKVLRNIE